MIINNSQNIQTSNPLTSSSSQRVNTTSRATNADPEDTKKIEQAQKQQDDSVVRQLRARDREVRSHEAAHVAAGGSLVRSGPSYSFQRGPDGRSYAVGGEVQLDVSPVDNDPQATVNKAGQIRAAALAPANPSPQDLRVAANANQLASRARVDLAVQRREEAKIDENKQQVDSLSNESEAGENEALSVDNSSSASSIDPSSSISSSLQSNDVPIAAISSFMATAQTEAVPVRFNQFA